MVEKKEEVKKAVKAEPIPEAIPEPAKVETQEDSAGRKFATNVRRPG